MIALTRMDRQTMFINPDHIVSIEETPDTVITLFNGHHFIVMESARMIIDKIISYRAMVIRRSGRHSARKYLDRQKTEHFRSVTLNRAISFPENRAGHENSPVRSREF